MQLSLILIVCYLHLQLQDTEGKATHYYTQVMSEDYMYVCAFQVLFHHLHFLSFLSSLCHFSSPSPNSLSLSLSLLPSISVWRCSSNLCTTTSLRQSMPTTFSRPRRPSNSYRYHMHEQCSLAFFPSSLRCSLQDQLSTTSSNYESQLSTMSDHLCEMRDRMLVQEEEMEVLRRGGKVGHRESSQ